MDSLLAYLDGYASCAVISLSDPQWHTSARIPNEPGWYFIRTNAPVTVLMRQTRWAATYATKKAKTAKVKNYDIAARACRYNADLGTYWNTSEVYSGMAAQLQARAREHTFSDPGTAGLALSKYPELRSYEWLFAYVTLRRFKQPVSCGDMLLRLGEQVWRSKHGWPLLCAE